MSDRSEIPLPRGKYKITLDWESEDGTSTLHTEHYLMAYDAPEAAYVQEYEDLCADDVKVAILPNAPQFDLAISGTLLAMPNADNDRTYGRIVSTNRAVEVRLEE